MRKLTEAPINRGHTYEGTALFDQKMVAELFGISTARVQQIESLALRKIRREVIREARLAGVSPQEWILGG